MADKPKRASEYTSEQAELVKATCLYVATKLGDMMDDLVVVGGLVPSLIIDQEMLPTDVAPHVGTMDLDVGLQVALLHEGRYRQLTERLRDAGFAMDKNDAGNPTRQRWAISHGGTVTVDFLIQPTNDGDKGGKLRDLEPDFAAIIAPGLRCAFRDREQVTVRGKTLFGERATRDIWVAGAAAGCTHAEGSRTACTGSDAGTETLARSERAHATNTSEERATASDERTTRPPRVEAGASTRRRPVQQMPEGRLLSRTREAFGKAACARARAAIPT